MSTHKRSGVPGTDPVRYIEELEAERDTLRVENERLKAEKRLMLFPIIGKWRDRAKKAEEALEEIANADHTRLGWAQESEDIARNALKEKT